MSRVKPFRLAFLLSPSPTGGTLLMNFTGIALLILMALPFSGAHAAGAAPIAFSLQSPVNRSASESTTTDFSWGYSSYDATYTIEVATDAGFGAANVVNNSGLTTTSYTLPT